MENWCRRFKKCLGLADLASYGLSKVWSGLSLLWWTQSAKLPADSIVHDKIAGFSRLSGLSLLNTRLKRWHLEIGGRSNGKKISPGDREEDKAHHQEEDEAEHWTERQAEESAEYQAEDGAERWPMTRALEQSQERWWASVREAIEKRVGDRRKKRLDWVREGEGMKEERRRVRMVISLMMRMRRRRKVGGCWKVSGKSQIVFLKRRPLLSSSHNY